MSIVVRLAVVAVGALLAVFGAKRIKSSRAARRAPMDEGVIDTGLSLADEPQYAHSGSHH